MSQIEQDILKICEEETLNETNIVVIASKLDEVYKKFEKIRTLINQQKSIKRIQDRATEKQMDITEFLSKFGHRYKNIKTVEQFNNTLLSIKNLQDMQQDQNFKSQIMSAKNIIMTIRSLVIQSNINYKLFIVGTKTTGQQVILMGDTPLDTMVRESGYLNNNLETVFSLTTTEAQKIIDNYDMENSIMGQWKNILTPERQQAWEYLTKIQQKTKGFNSGELLESLIALDNQALEVDNIYNALLQGLNTTPWEVSGDFAIEGEDIQSKVITAQGAPDQIHRIRYVSISNICRVLKNLVGTFNTIANNPNTLKQELSKVFTNSQGFNKFKKGSEDQLKKIINEVLSNKDVIPF